MSAQLQQLFQDSVGQRVVRVFMLESLLVFQLDTVFVGAQFTEATYDFLVFAMHKDDFAECELSKRLARPHVFERLLHDRVFRGVTQLSPDRWIFNFGRYGIAFHNGQARIVIGDRSMQDIAADETCDVDEQLRDYTLGM